MNNRPERKHNRIPGYDYSRSNYYFVTLNVRDRSGWFGNVVDGKMRLNEAGSIAERRWKWLAEQYPYVTLDEYVIMPNHVHGIIVIDNPDDGGVRMDGTGEYSRMAPVKTVVKIKSLSSLMGAFQTTASKLIRKSGMPDFAWQRSFHDRVIRDEDGLTRVREYIRNNPVRWMEKQSTF